MQCSKNEHFAWEVLQFSFDREGFKATKKRTENDTKMDQNQPQIGPKSGPNRFINRLGPVRTAFGSKLDTRSAWRRQREKKTESYRGQDRTKFDPKPRILRERSSKNPLKQ